MGTIRLYIDQPLQTGQAVPLAQAQAHYLGHVMRQGSGALIEVFNGRDGSWSAAIDSLGKRGGQITPLAQVAAQRMPPDLWLLFAPLKKARTDFIVEKAAELGCARILPVVTAYTNSDRIAHERLQAHAVEAAEQCGGTFVPEVGPLAPLMATLAALAPERRILWADESRAGPADVLSGLPRGPWAVLVGPEGGFSPDERTRLAAMAPVIPVSLGPRILRADTASVALMTLWQANLGDWS